MNLIRRTWATAGSAVLALTLLGCAVEVPEFTPPPRDEQVLPVMDEARMDRVLAGVEEHVAAADADLKKDELPPRVIGRAAQMRGWEFTLAAKTKEIELETPYVPQPLTTDPLVEIIAATDTWPRQVMVITDPPPEGNTNLLLVLEQADPRAEYALMSWVRLLPGVTTPAADAAAIGSVQLAPDAEGLKFTPEAAIANYTDLLNNGSESKHADAFEEDSYRTLLEEELKALKEAVTRAGKMSQETTKVGSVYTLQTFDGGAIVVGGMKSEQVYDKTVSGAKMRVGGMIAALNGGTHEVQSKLIATYEHMVAFYVPPADSDKKVTLLGAERILSKVE